MQKPSGVTEDPDNHSPAWQLGQIVQGLVLGVALYLAVCQLVLETGSRIFRYQGF